ncbi:serine/threonine-protein kinase [Motilibacter rhizosphaerae]|uniref:non-specific serine/threonine protein kinase n=1 Tax=Motilibacter rhizosphaerae TaxID=598652 RepID=A0A4Q7NVH2_9ACTN|nr:Stk1 family PASTA domain-containing Ser/Thr kinase [Motilibacter rhizosphaerae]RZS91253.1 serine/threonine-protein kinase [Motilibacter rhizosphaerae]
MTAEPLLLGGRYEIREVLGRGGMAEVHRALDVRLGRVVAVKMLRADLARDPEFQDRFKREAQSAASLNHPTIVAVYDTGEDWVGGARVPFIVMELVEGSTLRDLLASGRRPLPERSLEIVSGILTALDYSHRHGIVHRDIKPGNVMLTPRGEVKVMDFGIARTIAEATAAVTQGSAVVGTAQYLSPEQARAEQVDARTDLYSTGCVLFELLTGRPPFVGESSVSIAYQHVSEPPPAPSSLDPSLGASVDAVVLRALAKERTDRYPTAAAMKADVDRVRGGGAVPMPLLPRPEVTSATQAIPPVRRAQPPTVVRREQVPVAPVAYEQGPRRGRGGAYALLALALVAVLVVGVVVARQYLSDRKVQVPSVSGMTVDLATTKLQGAGLKVASPPQKRASKDVSEGLVISTDPDGEVPKGSVVAIIVSSGPDKVPVPSVQGSTYADAVDQLKSAGLLASRKEVDSTNGEDAGTVLDTDPKVGTSVLPGSTVVLSVANGRVPIPDVKGKQLADAKLILANSAGQFRTSTASVKVDSQDQDGVVLSQAPDAGSTAPKGARIILRYGRYTAPPPPSTPAASTPGDGGASQPAQPPQPGQPGASGGPDQ